MQKNILLEGVNTQYNQQNMPFSDLLYSLALTEPHLASLSHNIQLPNTYRRTQNHNRSSMNRQSHPHPSSIIQQLGFKNSSKNIGVRKKSQRIDLQSLPGRLSQYGNECMRDLPSKNNKIIINSSPLHEMRKRNSNSEMKHYRQGSKLDKIEGGLQIKKGKKKRSSQYIGPIKKQSRHIIDINPNYTAISQVKKKHSKNNIKTIKHSSTVSAKLHKNQFKSTELVLDRRCRSSLREKQSSKVLTDLKSIVKDFPISSKLNSLYSNTTSIYGSRKQLKEYEKKMLIRIPTQQVSQQLQEIRKYQSLILTTQKTPQLLRKRSKKELVKDIISTCQVYPQQIKTQQIINNYLHKIRIESVQSLEIINTRQFDQDHQFYNQTSLNAIDSKSGKSGSFIHTIQQQDKKEKTQLAKLHEIIRIIEKNDSLIKEEKDKQYVLSTIKDILASKSNPTQIQVLDKYEPIQPNTKSYLNSSSLNVSSLKDSLSSEADISVLNLEILDRALRQREQYLQNRLRRELQILQQQRQQQPSKAQNISRQIDKIKKWINHQIRQVHNTRTQLWKGFSVAKILLKQQLNDKSRQMMKCLSEKYINRNINFSKIKKQFEDRRQQQFIDKNIKKQISDQKFEQMEPRICDSDQQDQQINSKYSYSPLVQHDHLHLQDLRYLTSSDSKRYEQQSNDELQDNQQNIFPIKDVQQSEEKILKRQRLHCESPISDSQNESYGGIILQRYDEFTFSEQKKEYNNLINLSIQNKQDICQFIFLDLCIQISDQYNKESKIIKSLLQFLQKLKNHSKKQKGFKTNSIAIKDYLTYFISFLKNKPQIIQEIHYSLDKPMGPTAIEILRYMHTFNQDIDDQAESYILTARIFDLFQDSYMKNIKIDRYYDDDQRQNKRKIFLKNAIHIHNKAIYDAYNQTLDKDRPFGMWGQPFSWKKVAKFSHQRDVKTKNVRQEILLRRAQQTIEYSHYMCGFILDKQDCALKDNPQVTDAYIEQIRYDRLSQMMAKQLQQTQQRMQFFDDEQTQILVDMSQSIFIRMILEICSQIFLFI